MSGAKEDAGCANIELARVGMVYKTSSGAVEALRDISLTVNRGEFVSLVGPSGCGKSTLLRIIAGLRQATSGAVTVNGVEVAKPISNIGMVFQSPVLLKWRTILDNVLLPVELTGLARAKYRQRAFDLLQLVGLGDFAGKLPGELSGGMQQRVSICRALLLDPPLLLMDEPFGALDAMTRDEMNFELLRIWGEGHGFGDQRKTIVFVTHSIQEAVILSDRVVVMSERPGHITNVREIELSRPRTIEMRASEQVGRLSLEIYRALNRRKPLACPEKIA
jgi:NitT/TauT family transport system ATP-binding protein